MFDEPKVEEQSCLKIIFCRIRELRCLERIGIAQWRRKIRRRLTKMCESGAQLPYPSLLLWQDSYVIPRQPCTSWYRHVYRENNTRADYLTNLVRATDSDTSTYREIRENWEALVYVRAYFGGGLKDGIATIGWVLHCSCKVLVSPQGGRSCSGSYWPS